MPRENFVAAPVLKSKIRRVTKMVQNFEKICCLAKNSHEMRGFGLSCLVSHGGVQMHSLKWILLVKLVTETSFAN